MSCFRNIFRNHKTFRKRSKAPSLILIKSESETMFVTHHDIKINLQPLLCIFQYQYVVAKYHILFSAYTKYSFFYIYDINIDAVNMMVTNVAFKVFQNNWLYKYSQYVHNMRFECNFVCKHTCTNAYLEGLGGSKVAKPLWGRSGCCEVLLTWRTGFLICSGSPESDKKAGTWKSKEFNRETDKCKQRDDRSNHWDVKLKTLMVLY